MLNLSLRQITVFAVICLGIVFCYLFFPISYANIASSITAQSSKRAILWAIINFLTHILTIILNHLLSQYITLHQSQTKTQLLSKHPDSSAQQLKSINAIVAFFPTFTNSLLLILKLLAITLSALAYSFYLSIAIAFAIFVCLFVSLVIQKSTYKKLQAQSICDKPSLFQQKDHLTTEIIWTIFFLAITLNLIDLINTQKITLTVFLVVTTFINTHLLKPNFNSSLGLETQLLKQAIFEFNKEKY